MRLDDGARGVELQIEYAFQQHGLGHRAAHVEEQHLQHGEFAVGEVDRRALDGDAARQPVEDDAVLAEHAEGGWRAPADRLDPRVELLHLERLDQVVVGADAKPFDAIRDAAEGSQEDHRRVHARGAQRLQEVEAAQSRQHPVEDDDVIAAGAGPEQSVAAIAFDVHVMAPAGQAGANEIERLNVVLDDQQVQGRLLARELKRLAIQVTRDGGKVRKVKALRYRKH